MANFFIIDHSLKDAGGHHFDYARCVCEAASELGYAPVVGTHRRFRPSQWPTCSTTSDEPSVNASLHRADSNVAPAILPVFRQTTYQRDSYLAGLQQMTRSKTESALEDESQMSLSSRWKHRARHLLHRRRREWFVRQFAADCGRFFKEHPQRSGDHVFLTTISELELMGLALYLSSAPQSLHAHWHLQFHFNLFAGRTPEYAKQAHLSEAIGACFMAALSRMSYHSVNFYTTSLTLAEQYNSLGVCEFKPLPYPIARDFQLDGVHEKPTRRTTAASATWSGEPYVIPFGDVENSVESTETDERAAKLEAVGEHPDVIPFPGSSSIEKKPLRFTCPGGIRREKGQSSYLQNLTNHIWESHLQPGLAQLVVQRPSARWSKSAKLHLATPQTTQGEVLESDSGRNPIEYVKHPLPQQEYVDLIRSTDVGLLFYDSRVYFSRRAGVLGELLACGKPVIVSAGSWLADQIETANFDYVDRTLSREFVIKTLELGQLSWDADNVPLPGGVVSFDRYRHPFEFSFDSDTASAAIIEFEWHWPKEKGVCCRLELVELDEHGNEISAQPRVIGVRRHDEQANALFTLDARTRQIRCGLTNAFDESTATIRRLSIKLLGGEHARRLPSSSVGLIAADQSDLVRCVDEMVEHYDHYRETAEAFATRWYANHDPRLTVRNLLAVDHRLRRVA